MNSRAKMIMINTLRIVCCYSIATQLLLAHAVGQSDGKSQRNSLASRLAMLDPSNSEEYASEVDSLRMSMPEEKDSLIHDIVESYLSVLEDDRSALSAVLGKLTSRWSDVPMELRPTILRLSLVAAVEDRAEARAESIYKELTRLALRDDVDTVNRRECAEIVGFLNGLFGTEEGTLSAEVRQKADGLLDQAQDVRSNYSVGQQKGNSLRMLLYEQKAAWELLEFNERAPQIEQLQSALDELVAEYESKQDETRAENADQRAVWTTTFATRKRLVGNLNLVIEDSRYPTPGHPGAPPVKPAEPNRDSIKVDEYETKKEKRGDKTVEVKERKSQREIEREKDQKFFAWQQRYAVEKPIYDQKIATYRRELQAWTDLDNMRRKELFDLYIELTTRIDRIDQEKKAADQSKKETMEEIDRMGDSIKELRDKVRTWKLLEEGVRRGEHDYFLRAGMREGIDPQRELQTILRWIRTHP